MPIYIDQIGNAVSLEKVDSIISLVPSQTELLYHLGLDNKVTGITKFCIKPNSWFKHKTRIGGTKNLKLDLINKIKPDLIIGNKEENNKEDIEALINAGHQVWMSDIFNDKDNLEMISEVGKMTSTEIKANSIIEEFNKKITSFNKTNVKVAYFIWKDPYFIVGNNNYIDYNLRKIGLVNSGSNFNRYQEVSIDEIRNLDADYFLFSSEPFPFQEKHLPELEKLFGKDKCLLVDGEMFSWTGYRAIPALNYFIEFLDQISRN